MHIIRPNGTLSGSTLCVLYTILRTSSPMSDSAGWWNDQTAASCVLEQSWTCQSVRATAGGCESCDDPSSCRRSYARSGIASRIAGRSLITPYIPRISSNHPTRGRAHASTVRYLLPPAPVVALPCLILDYISAVAPASARRILPLLVSCPTSAIVPCVWWRGACIALAVLSVIRTYDSSSIHTQPTAWRSRRRSAC